MTNISIEIEADIICDKIVYFVYDRSKSAFRSIGQFDSLENAVRFAKEQKSKRSKLHKELEEARKRIEELDL